MATEEFELFYGRPSDENRIMGEAESATYDFLDKTGITYHTLCHKAAYTMEECEAVRNKIGAPVFKNLFLTNKQHSQFYLLMMPAGKPFKTKYLSGQLGCARLSFATTEEMMELLHISPGSVSPLGLIHDKEGKVKLIVDKDLTSNVKYACHPCVNTASVCLDLHDLLDVVVPATSHHYTWVEMPV